MACAVVCLQVQCAERQAAAQSRRWGYWADSDLTERGSAGRLGKAGCIDSQA